jgi:hypothetical protein
MRSPSKILITVTIYLFLFLSLFREVNWFPYASRSTAWSEAVFYMYGRTQHGVLGVKTPSNVAEIVLLTNIL